MTTKIIKTKVGSYKLMEGLPKKVLTIKTHIVGAKTGIEKDGVRQEVIWDMELGKPYNVKKGLKGQVKTIRPINYFGTIYCKKDFVPCDRSRFASASTWKEIGTDIYRISVTEQEFEKYSGKKIELI